MLGALILENFKAFGERHAIPLAPITLIFGANSAGKSSILQSLLMLKQTLGEAESSDTVLAPSGRLVDLGNYREMIFDHDTERLLEISPLLRLSTSEGLVSFGAGYKFKYDTASQAVQLYALPFYQGESSQAAYQQRVMNLGGRTNSFFPDTVGVIKDSELADKHPLWARLAEPNKYLENSFVTDDHPFWQDVLASLLQNNGYVTTLNTVMHFLDNNYTEISESRFLHDFVDMFSYHELDPQKIVTDTDVRERLRLMVSNELEKMATYSLVSLLEHVRLENCDNYFNLRNFIPDLETRTFIKLNDEAWASWEAFLTRWLSIGPGDYAHDPTVDLAQLTCASSAQLRQVLEHMVYLGPLGAYPERQYMFTGTATQQVGRTGRLLPDLLFKQPELVIQANEMLRTLGLGYTLKVHTASEPALQDLFVLRLVDDRGISVSMRDVGFGISQVLPVIVQSILSQKKVILIEQPELHLHPRLQAELGSLFAHCISAPQENQFIIETHSEHLILRLQKLIRTGLLKPSDVSVIYVMKKEDGSHAYPLRLDEDGDFIDAWPEGFFEEGYREIFS